MTSDEPWHVERVSGGIVDSTNRVAADHVRLAWKQGGSAHGFAILAERQSAGRGQHERVWESPAGGLYLSAVVERVPAGLRDRLAIIAGVAVATALSEAGVRNVGLRWPNDLMLGGTKKVGGILCEGVAMEPCRDENSAGTKTDRWAGIIGVGVNINTNLADFPPPLRTRATSLLAHDGRRRDLRDIESRILHALAQAITCIQTEGFEPILHAARTWDTLRGQHVELRDGESIITGTAEGIGDSGELLIRTAGSLQRCTTGTLITINGERLRAI